MTALRRVCHFTTCGSISQNLKRHEGGGLLRTADTETENELNEECRTDSLGSSQCVHQPTHCCNHTLDLVLSYGVKIENLTVLPRNPNPIRSSDTRPLLTMIHQFIDLQLCFKMFTLINAAKTFILIMFSFTLHICCTSVRPGRGIPHMWQL